MCIDKWLCYIAKSMGGCTPTIYPNDYNIYSMNYSTVRDELTALGIICMDNNLPDINFYYTDISRWQEIIKYLTYSAEYYSQSERKDCDDYSKKASADSSFNFGLNTIQAWGHTPNEYHAFNLVKTLDGYMIFEPNAGFECAGELMELNNKYGWSPDKWKP